MRVLSKEREMLSQYTFTKVLPTLDAYDFDAMRTFVRTYEQYFRENANQTQVQMWSLMSGPARSLLKSDVEGMKEPPDNEALKTALIAALGPTSKRAARELVKGLSSGKTAWSLKDMSSIVYQIEELSEFVADKYWPSDKSLIKIFTTMIDSDTADQVWSEEVKTFKKAWKVARKYAGLRERFRKDKFSGTEKAKSSFNGNQLGGKKDHTDSKTSESRQKYARKDDTGKRVAQDGKQPSRDDRKGSGTTDSSYQPRCHKCGQLGHLRKDCSRKGDTGKAGKEKGKDERRVNAAAAERNGRVSAVSWLPDFDCRNGLAFPNLTDAFTAAEQQFYADTTVRVPPGNGALLTTLQEEQAIQRVLKPTDPHTIFNVECNAEEALDDLKLGGSAIHTTGFVVLGEARVPAHTLLDSGANISLIAPQFLRKLAAKGAAVSQAAVTIKTFNNVRSGCSESIVCTMEFTNGLLKPVQFAVTLYSCECAYDIILSGPMLKHTGLLGLLTDIAALEDTAASDEIDGEFPHKESEDIPTLVQLHEIPDGATTEYASVMIPDSVVAERCHRLVKEFSSVFTTQLPEGGARVD